MQHTGDVRVLLRRGRPHDSPTVIGEELDEVGTGSDATSDCLAAFFHAIDGVRSRR
jgi:hypothetical protein